MALTLGLAVCAGPALARAKSSSHSAPRGAVTVRRDRAGIPHITATNFTALGLGEGYAFAQDNLCTFADDIVTVNGDRSKYFGPNALALNYSAATSSTNLQSDLYWRHVKGSGIVKRQLNSKLPNGLLLQVRQIYNGFVSGYNRYLRSGKLRDPRGKGRRWVRPINLTDMLLRGEQIVTEGSAQQFLSGIVDAQPPPAGAQASAARASKRAPDLAALRAQFGNQADRAAGSNGIGAGSRDTRSGGGIVLANPHFPWRGTERFWMAQLDVPGRYNVEGGTLEGLPLVGIGFNRNIAWTHTVSTSRRFVAYQLRLVPDDPTSYFLDDKPVKMGRATVSVKYGGTTVRHTFYTTRWGLVTTVSAAHYAWTPTTAYALYDAVAGVGPRAADQYLRMGQARSVSGLFNVEAKWLAIPTFNTVGPTATVTPTTAMSAPLRR